MAPTSTQGFRRTEHPTQYRRIAGSEIVGYHVVVECEEPELQVFTADVGPTVSSITVSPEFLDQGGEECKWEVLAIEATVSSSRLAVAASLHPDALMVAVGVGSTARVGTGGLAGMETFADNFELAGGDEALERFPIGILGGDLPSFARSQVKHFAV